MKFNFKSADPTDSVILSGEFIKDYMLKANGAYLKLYLFILYNSKKDMSVKNLAFELELTENDVKHAIEYWKKSGMITEEEKSESKAEAENISDDNYINAADELIVKDNASAHIEDKYDEKEDYPVRLEDEEPEVETYEDESIDIIELSSDPDFETLIYFIQQLRKKNLSNNDVQILAYLYKNLGLSVDLLEHLVESCV